MLANVLKSSLAVRASIQVVRAFVRLRQALTWDREVARKIEALERRVGKHDADLQDVLGILRRLLEPPVRPRRAIGFPTAEQAPGRSRSRPLIQASAGAASRPPISSL